LRPGLASFAPQKSVERRENRRWEKYEAVSELLGRVHNTTAINSKTAVELGDPREV
jgi:hypothetical protein